MARKENASYEKTGQRRSLGIDEALKRISELELQLTDIGSEINEIKKSIDGTSEDISSLQSSLSSKANLDSPTIMNPTLRFLLADGKANAELRRSGSEGQYGLSIVFNDEEGNKTFYNLVNHLGEAEFMPPEYKQLWSGSVTQDGNINVPDITKYNTYAIVASSYPMALYGMRWGSSILAFGIDCNSDAGFRVASIKLTVDSSGAVTVTRSKVANMAFGASNGSASNFTFTNIYGVT